MKKFVCGLVVLISLLVVTGCGFMSQINNSADVKGTELKFNVPVVAGNKCVIALDNSQNWAEVISTRTNQPDFSTNIANNIINVNYTGSDTVAKETKNVGVQICSKDGREVYKQVDVQMTVGGWKVVTTADLSWYNGSQGSSNFTIDNEGTITHTSTDGNLHELVFDEKIKGIRFETCSYGNILIFTELKGFAHNGLFIGNGNGADYAGSHYETEGSVNWGLSASMAGLTITGERKRAINNVGIERQSDDSVIVSNNGELWMHYDSKAGAEILGSTKRFGMVVNWNSGNNTKTITKMLVRE